MATMSEAAERLEDVEKEIAAEDAALEETRGRRRAVLEAGCLLCGVLDTYASGSVAMGVVNDPVEDADGGIILDCRQYPGLGSDGAGETRVPSSPNARHRRPCNRETWPKATVHDRKRGITVRMHASLPSGADPYVDMVVTTRSSPLERMTRGPTDGAKTRSLPRIRYVRPAACPPSRLVAVPDRQRAPRVLLVHRHR